MTPIRQLLPRLSHLLFGSGIILLISLLRKINRHPAKRKSRSKADDLDQIATFVTTNNISNLAAILFHTYPSLFPALAFFPSLLIY
jgi:hypothetical protein